MPEQLMHPPLGASVRFFNHPDGMASSTCLSCFAIIEDVDGMTMEESQRSHVCSDADRVAAHAPRNLIPWPVKKD